MASAFWKTTLFKLTLGLIPSAFGFLRRVVTGGTVRDSANAAAAEALPIVEDVVEEVVGEVVKKTLEERAK